MPTEEIPEPFERYIRQIKFPGFGLESQQQLSSKRVLIVGCGALGTHIAESIVRAGVKHVRLVDRDFVELSNLQRQVLFTEQDVANSLPKAICAAEKLAAINSQVTVEPIVTDVDATNIRSLCDQVDCIIDGTDNFETRFLINDASHKLKIPWVYGGCLGAEGQTMTIIPGETPCLQCLIPECPPPGTTPTCDTAGILSPAIAIIAAFEVMEVLKILSGNIDQINRKLTAVDLWNNQVRQMNLDKLKESQNCPTCKQGDYAYFEGRKGNHTTVLCGRNAVQLNYKSDHEVDLEQLAENLESLGEVEKNSFLLRFHVQEYIITVFRDGRAIINGTEDIIQAKKLYAQYIGA